MSFIMVGVAQLVELQVVALVAAGSSPVAHPNFFIADCAFRIADFPGVCFRIRNRQSAICLRP